MNELLTLSLVELTERLRARAASPVEPMEVVARTALASTMALDMAGWGGHMSARRNVCRQLGYWDFALGVLASAQHLRGSEQ